MRVAFLTHEPFHPPSGGGSAEASYLVRELVRRGHEVHLFGPQPEAPEQVARDFGITVHPFTAWAMGRTTRWRNFKYLAYPRALQRLVERAAASTRFDLVLSQHAISAVAAGRLKRRLGVPAVLNFLDYLTGFMETWPAWLMPPPALAVLKRYELAMPRRFDADAVLTVSDTLADRFAAAGCSRERLTSIYYGFDAGLFRLDPAAVAARRDSPPEIVMHGSFDHHHLGRIALATVARVREQRPDAVFRFIGPATEAWERFAAQAAGLGLAGALRHEGFVPYREIPPRLATATLGLVPYEESSGTHCAFVAKAVEYLALGLPVVSTPLEGIRRYFADEPLARFSQFDGTILGDTILDWLDEPKSARDALAAPASARVRAKLDWSVICARAAEVVESVASRHAGFN
jgi:glycosyltransferase involved in cell wall biosynthesis